MAVRTTATLVKLIIDIDPSLTNLTPFITMASLQVDQHCSGYDATADAVLLELIERNLAAHHLCMRDPRIQSEKAGVVAATYIAPLDGRYFEATIYGQTALAMDWRGGLSALQATLKKGAVPFSIGWAGVPTRAEVEELAIENME